MRILILQRHAKAVRDHQAPTDRARMLTEGGRADAAEAGRRLAALDLGLDAVRVSPALRTRETWGEMAAFFPGVPAELDETLYLAEPEEIWAAAQASGGEVVVIVGHNSGLHDLIQHLVADARDHSALARGLAADLPTAAFAAFALTGDSLAAPGASLVSAWRPARDRD